MSVLKSSIGPKVLGKQIYKMVVAQLCRWKVIGRTACCGGCRQAVSLLVLFINLIKKSLID